jgi:hypothetical protein
MFKLEKFWFLVECIIAGYFNFFLERFDEEDSEGENVKQNERTINDKNNSSLKISESSRRGISSIVNKPKRTLYATLFSTEI